MEEHCADSQPGWRSCRKTVSLVFSGGIPRRSARIALVVGTILTLINQYDALMVRHGFSWLQACLTYCVPYCVATYSALMIRLTRNKPT